MCEVGIVRESLHISFFGGRDPLCVLKQQPENTRYVCLRDQWTSPLHLSDQRISAFSSKLQTLYCLFKSHADLWTSSSPQVLAGYQNLHSSSFFSGNLLILSVNGNICHSIHRQWIIFWPLCFIFLFPWNFVDVILRPHWIIKAHCHQLS